MKALPGFIAGLVLLTLLAGCASPGTTVTPLASVPVTEPAPSPDPSTSPSPDYWPTLGWRSSTPEAQGMDSDRLADMFAEIEAKQMNLHSLLVVRHGYLVAEAYFQPYTAETNHSIESLTKSIMGTLIGIAIDQGYIKSIDQKVIDFFPGKAISNLDERKRAMTLRHLLSLTSGLDCQDGPDFFDGWWASQDWIQYMLDRPMKSTPGTQWSYCTGAAHLLSAILKNATGMDARAFANANLFEPLGIPEVPLERWSADPLGLPFGGAGLTLAPRDLAKYAFLYLNRGNWDGRQVVPAEWVDASVVQQAYAGVDPDYGNMPRGYGYLWSVFPERGFYSALGRGGQHIHVFPDQDLIVIFTGAMPVNTFHFDLLEDYLLPAVKSTTPLPENLTGASRLEDCTRKTENPRLPVPALPTTAQKISGKTFTFPEDNLLGWETLRLTFREGADTALISVNGSPDLAIGLDHLYRNLDGSLWARGSWEDEDSFLAETLYLGTLQEGEVRLNFGGDGVKVFTRDRVFGGGLVYISGEMK